LFYLDSRNIYRTLSFEQIPGIEHGFGTRLSSGWPNSEAGEKFGLVTMRQVHSDRILLAERAGCAGEADALITNQPGLMLSIRTADCLPILLADVRNRAVAAVHAGWRGTVLGILEATVKAMTDRFGTQVNDLQVAGGPGIGVCCFQVGSEVAVQFRRFFPERSDLEGCVKIDLIETNRRQLRQIGLSDSQFVFSRECTFCGGDLFESYRRDREAAGRMVSAIGIAGVCG
jgi:YfiH family protein